VAYSFNEFQIQIRINFSDHQSHPSAHDCPKTSWRVPIIYYYVVLSRIVIPFVRSHRSPLHAAFQYSQSMFFVCNDRPTLHSQNKQIQSSFPVRSSKRFWIGGGKQIFLLLNLHLNSWWMQTWPFTVIPKQAIWMSPISQESTIYFNIITSSRILFTRHDHTVCMVG
jgi:hypothetical protein